MAPCCSTSSCMFTFTCCMCFLFRPLHALTFFARSLMKVQAPVGSGVLFGCDESKMLQASVTANHDTAPAVSSCASQPPKCHMVSKRDLSNRLPRFQNGSSARSIDATPRREWPSNFHGLRSDGSWSTMRRIWPSAVVPSRGSPQPPPPAIAANELQLCFLTVRCVRTKLEIFVLPQGCRLGEQMLAMPILTCPQVALKIS